MPDPADQSEAADASPDVAPAGQQEWTPGVFRARVDEPPAALRDPLPAPAPGGADSPSLSLLARINDHRSSVAAWNQLDSIYGVLLRRWAARWNLQTNDADDLTQDILVELRTLLPIFQHSGQPGAFRAWLRGILANRVKEFQRRRFWFWRRNRALTAELETADSPLAQLWDQEHDEFVTQRVREYLARSVSDRDAEVFNLAVTGELKPREIAARFGITTDSVHQIKHRILKQLRIELHGLVAFD